MAIVRLRNVEYCNELRWSVLLARQQGMPYLGREPSPLRCRRSMVGCKKCNGQVVPEPVLVRKPHDTGRDQGEIVGFSYRGPRQPLCNLLNIGWPWFAGPQWASNRPGIHGELKWNRARDRRSRVVDPREAWKSRVEPPAEEPVHRWEVQCSGGPQVAASGLDGPETQFVLRQSVAHCSQGFVAKSSHPSVCSKRALCRGPGRGTGSPIPPVPRWFLGHNRQLLARAYHERPRH